MMRLMGKTWKTLKTMIVKSKGRWMDNLLRPCPREVSRLNQMKVKMKPTANEELPL